MTDQKAAVYPFDIATLISTGRFADRFSYSSYFVPVRVAFKDDPHTPILTFPQREWISRFGSKLPDEVMDRWLHDLGMSRLTDRNSIEIRPEVVAVAAPVAVDNATTATTPSDTRTAGSKVETIAELRLLSRIVAGTGSAENRNVSTLLTETVEKLGRESSSAAATAVPYDRERQEPIERPKLGTPGDWAIVTGTSDDEGKDLLLTLVQSEIGYLFLDRTRIRPKGFAIGEHVYSLSLAPSEEVTLEQKTYSKRTETMEEADEREQSLELELSSTLTTELNESMDRTHSLTDNWGLNVSHTGAYSSPPFFWGSMNASHTIAYSKNVTEASSETARRSIKDSQANSSKISAKFRSLHKVSFSVKTETGFESTSKRLIRNQNRFTPVDYHFFKFLRVLELAQERYGVMLCWAPFVESPAEQFFVRLQEGKNEILRRAEGQIPSPPQPPQTVPAVPQSKRISSSQVEANSWGPMGEMFQYYTLSIPIPQGWEWDEEKWNDPNEDDKLRVSKVYVADSGIDAQIVGYPSNEGTQLKIIVSVAVKNVFDRGDNGKPSRVWLTANAYFTETNPAQPVSAAAETAAYADFVTQHASWAEEAAKIRADAVDAADKWEAAMLANFSPVNELVNRLIIKHFAADVRDEGAEIELWQRIFQWDAASYVLYPGYWTGGSMRDPLGDPNSFFNASWARLFLPVRPGMEAMAMRWIFSKTTSMPLESGLDEAISDIVDDLETHRQANYPTTITPSATPGGCPDYKETCVCLGRWEELMPTDGTHIEVTQSASLSIDSFAQTDLEDTADLRAAVLESRKQDAEIKRKTASNMAGAATVEVKIRTDAGSGGSTDSNS